MNKKLILALIIVLVAVIAAIFLVFNIGEKIQPQADYTKYAEIGNEFTLKINGTAIISSANLEIKLENIVVNLCPQNALCLIADSVEIKLNVNNRENVSLNTFNSQTEIQGYALEFVNIEPNPLETKEKLGLIDYQITLRVSRIAHTPT